MELTLCPPTPADYSVSDDRADVAELVHRATNGDTDAFATLYARYHPTVLGFLRRRSPSPGTAEDIAADTFLRAFTSITSYEWREIDPAAWLCSIARNRLADHNRSSSRRHEVISDTLPDRPASDNPEDQALAGLDHDAVMEAINQLPDTQRECLTFRFIEQRSIADTAVLLGRSESAVKQIQARASRALRKQLTRLQLCPQPPCSASQVSRRRGDARESQASWITSASSS